MHQEPEDRHQQGSPIKERRPLQPAQGSHDECEQIEPAQVVKRSEVIEERLEVRQCRPRAERLIAVDLAQILVDLLVECFGLVVPIIGQHRVPGNRQRIWILADLGHDQTRFQRRDIGLPSL